MNANDLAQRLFNKMADMVGRNVANANVKKAFITFAIKELDEFKQATLTNDVPKATKTTKAKNTYLGWNKND
ncbi:MAG: hypothetical protein WC942_06785 [Clostridia bacterium]|jgi:hypothetical protein